MDFFFNEAPLVELEFWLELVFVLALAPRLVFFGRLINVDWSLLSSFNTSLCTNERSSCGEVVGSLSTSMVIASALVRACCLAINSRRIASFLMTSTWSEYACRGRKIRLLTKSCVYFTNARKVSCVTSKELL